MTDHAKTGSGKPAFPAPRHLERFEEDCEVLNQESVDDERKLENAQKVLNLIQRVRKSTDIAGPTARDHDTARQQQTVSAASDPSQLNLFEYVADLADPRKPHQIDRFQIKRQLGSGGYGFVFLAFDPMLDRHVALKVPRPEVLLDGNLRIRFQREAKAAAALSHPNIVPVFESGVEGPVCFIAYEYIEGNTLADWLRLNPNGLASNQQLAATIISSLAEAVHHAHQRGVWHRDLKPANVMLKTEQEADSSDPSVDKNSNTLRGNTSSQTASESDLRDSWFPMITDFGLAKFVTENDLSIHSDEQTCSNAIVGTPAYMAPEQTLAGERSFDARADVYALGAMLYELLTGRPPFQGPTVIDTLQQVRNTDPVQPAKINHGVSRDLSAICMKCLEKNPSARYPGAYELNQDLIRFMEGRSVVARPVTAINKLARWYQRNPRLAWSMTTAIAAIAMGLIAVTVLWLRADDLRRQAESRGIALWERTEQLETKTQSLQIRTEQLNDAIRGLFLEVAKSDEIKSPSAARLRQGILQRANQFYLSVISQQPDDQQFRLGRAETLFELAKVFEYLGDPTSALRLVHEAIDEVDPEDSSSRVLIQWHNYAGFRLHQLGRLDEANEEFAAALDIASEFDLHDPRGRTSTTQMIQATILTNQADLLNANKDVNRALELSNSALQIFQALEQDSSFATDRDYLFHKSNCFRIRGRAFGNLRKYPEHEQCLVAAIEILKPMVDDEVHLHHAARLNLGKCYYEKGVCHSRKNQLELARESYRLALEQYDALPDSLDLHLIKVEEYHRVDYSLAVADMLMGNFAEAESTILNSVQSLTRLIEQVPQESPSYLDSLGDRFNLLYVIRTRSPDNSHAEAEQAIRQAIDYYAQTLQHQPQWAEAQMALVQAQTNLGNVLVRQDRIEEAVEQYAIAEKGLAGLLRSRPDWANVRRGKCNLLQGKMDAFVRQGKFDLALPVCRDAQTFLATGMLNHILLDESWIVANLDELSQARDCLTRFAELHARRSRDYIAVARKSIEISELKPDSPEGSDFRTLAVAFLIKGLPDTPDQKRGFLDEIRNDDLLKGIAANIEQEN